MPIVQHLIVDEFGSFVAKKNGRLRVTCQGEKRGDRASDAPGDGPDHRTGRKPQQRRGSGLRRGGCAHPLPWDSRGKPVGSLYSAGLAATVQTRRAQLQARQDSRGLHVALAVAEGKLSNQINLLKYMAKYRKAKQPDLYKEVRLLADGSARPQRRTGPAAR